MLGLHFWDLLEERLVEFREYYSKSGKKLIFCLASTKGQNTSDLYIASLRVSHKYVTIPIFLRDLKIIEELSRKVDGLGDLILIDVEAKFEGLLDFPSRVKKYFVKTPISYFHGNQMTSKAVFEFVSQKFIQQKASIDQRKVLIFGLGHLGSKIALDLAEVGIEVCTTGRNYEKVCLKTRSIRELLAPHGQRKLRSYRREEVYEMSFDAVLGCANSPGVIEKEVIQTVKKEGFILDVGLGNFSEEAILWLNENRKKVYVTNIHLSYEACLTHSLLFQKELTEEEEGIIENIPVIKAGILAEKGKFIVDNIENPLKLFGVSKGNGYLLNSDELKAYSSELNILKKIIEENNNRMHDS